MPHKRNPIKAEQISGLSPGSCRGNSVAALEDVPLWHERDISHSSVERVILPDSTILIDYLQHRAIDLVAGMKIDKKQDAHEPRADPTAALFSPNASCWR